MDKSYSGTLDDSSKTHIDLLLHFNDMNPCAIGFKESILVAIDEDDHITSGYIDDDTKKLIYSSLYGLPNLQIRYIISQTIDNRHTFGICYSSSGRYVKYNYSKSYLYSNNLYPRLYTTLKSLALSNIRNDKLNTLIDG